MNEALLADSLSLLKIDLGITHKLRDAYFNSILKTAHKELSKMGVDLSKGEVEDIQLVVDYTVWNYRKRQEDVGLPRNIKFRIHNRVIEKAGGTNAEP